MDDDDNVDRFGGYADDYDKTKIIFRKTMLMIPIMMIQNFFKTSMIMMMIIILIFHLMMIMKIRILKIL